MISWVTMNRVVEEQMARDPKYRAETAGRPVRANANDLTEGELLAKLRFFGIEIDRAWLEQRCKQALSAEEIAQPLVGPETRHKHPDRRQVDWIWIALDALWRRWFPETPSFEALDDKVQAGYKSLHSSGAVAACPIWLEAWRDVRQLLEKGDIHSVKEFDERCGGSNSLFNWIQDLELELGNAGWHDPQFLTARIALCEEVLRRFPSIGDLTTENFRRALAQSYFESGQVDHAEALFREWLTADRSWGWGWIGWSDCYQSTKTERKDRQRAEQILRDGLAIPDVRDRADIIDRLADRYEAQGRGGEAQELRQEAAGHRSRARTSRRIASSGSELRQSVKVDFGAEGPPLEDLPKLVAETRGMLAAPVSRQKIGRNEPCPCGSGKKHKKCCGA